MDMSMMLGSFSGFTLNPGDSALAFSRTAAGILLTAIWQGTFVAGCLAICFKLAPRTTAALRFAIWAAGFIVVALLPFLPLLLAHFVSSAHADAAAGIAPNPARPWLQLDIRWSVALTAIWAIASFIRGANLVADSLRLRKFWRTATAVNVSISHPDSLAVPGRKPVQICTTQQLERPAVIGFLAPRILVPEWLMTRITPGELDQIVLHETEHLRRGDDWTNLLQKICLVIFPLNPVLLWIERRLCKEREMACDDGVVRVTHAPRAYAACLTGLAERGLHHRSEALSLGAWQGRPELVHRVHSILLRKPALGPSASRGMAALLGCSLVFGSIELARCPQLVAFVATSQTATNETRTAQANSPAVATRIMPQIRAPHMIPAAYTPLKNSMYNDSTSIPRITQLKATLSANPSSPRSASKTDHSGASKKFSATPRMVAAAVEVPSQPEEIMTSATTFESISAADGGEQHWFILATYEQRETGQHARATYSDSTSQRPDQSAEVSKNPATSQTAADSSDSATGEGADRITVTRLIFKIVPAIKADSTKQTPTAVVPVHSGWFFFQL